LLVDERLVNHWSALDGYDGDTVAEIGQQQSTPHCRSVVVTESETTT